MERSRFQLSQKDAVTWLRTLGDSSVDLVVTDPPYESLEKHRAVGTTTRLKNSKASSNDWFQIFPNARFEELFLEVHRVLKKDRHFYLFCDAETMFVAKPIGERVGFKFWKPIIWDKCLGPETLVWSARGVVRIDELEVGDRVAVPEGGTARVRGVRETRSPALVLELSDGTELTASLDHRLVRADGVQVEARQLQVGDKLVTRPVRLEGGESTPERVGPRPDLGVAITAIREVGVCDLVDISIDHPDELFVLGNGVVSHNCKIGMGYHYRARYECILFFEKGKRKLNNLGVADIISEPRIYRGYPAEKPPAVSQVLIEQSTQPGELVIDPFSGSGSVGVAAAAAGRDFAGNDICAEAVDIAYERIRDAGGIPDPKLVSTGPPSSVQLGLGL